MDDTNLLKRWTDAMIDFMYYLADQGEGELVHKILEGAQQERDKFLVKEFGKYMQSSGWITEVEDA